MKFKFNGNEVTFIEGELTCEDEVTSLLLTPLVGLSSDGPEYGDPLLNTITRVFGQASVMDVVFDADDNLIY